MSGRVVFVAVGVAAAVAGLAVAVRPSLAAGLSPTYLVVTLVGVFAVLQATGAAMARLRGERKQAEPPEVERRRVFPAPGTAFDESLASLPRRAGRAADRDRLSLRTELREVTEETLVRYGGLTPEEATERIEAGTWTEDVLAVSLFAPDAERGIPLTERVRSAFGTEQAFVRRSRAVVGALAAYAETGRTGGVPVTDDGTNGARTTEDERGADDRGRRSTGGRGR